MRAERMLRGLLMKALALFGLHPWHTCRACVELVTGFLEGVLSPQERALVLAHLKRCPHCPRYYRQIELTIRLAEATTSDSVPSATRAALLDAFRRQRERDPDEES